MKNNSLIEEDVLPGEVIENEELGQYEYWINDICVLETNFYNPKRDPREELELGIIDYHSFESHMAKNPGANIRPGEEEELYDDEGEFLDYGFSEYTLH